MQLFLRLMATVFVLSAGLAITGCQPASVYQEPPPSKVTVATPIVQTIPIWQEENGETEAVEQALVRSRVSGLLQEIKFQPDEKVEEGRPMFQIEQKEFLAAVQAATASVNSAKAALSSANASLSVADARIAALEAEVAVSQADFNRLSELVEDNAVARSDWEVSQANLATAQAALQGGTAARESAVAEIQNAEAEVEKAEAVLTQSNLELEWTTVTAPIGGRVTRILTKRGNLVENGTDLVEIVQHDPIWVNFNISDRLLLDLEREYGARSDSSQRVTDVTAYVKRSGDTGYPFEGTLDFADPRVDQATGTMQLRGVFHSQPGKFLLPGLFVRVRIQIGTRENALLIPERALNRDPAGTYVYVMGDDNIPLRTLVTPGPRYQDKIVIEEGLKEGDLVIVDGVQKIRPGVAVNPVPIETKDP
ncbi:MAG: efflux RND transporter periplasmic adaptor subunit [Pirellulaceae bacterium]